jgi:hypothetical protein
MRFQPLPNLTEEIYLEGIFRAKHTPNREILLEAQEDVLKRCSHYSEELAEARAPLRQDWTPVVSAALQSCYDGVTAPLGKLKDTILEGLKAHTEVNLQRCPYCMLNEPKTWDHYLPKGDFPEFSVCHKNLVYVCFGCNHRKHDRYLDGALIFCHPYYTLIERVPILHCAVKVVDDRLRIDYYCAGEGEHERVGHVAQRHLSLLGLDKRFRSEASSLVSGLIGELRATFPMGVSEKSLASLLRGKFAEARSLLGENAWDARLWHGLNHCEAFLDYANRRIVADNAPSADGFYIPAPPPQVLAP